MERKAFMDFGVLVLILAVLGSFGAAFFVVPASGSIEKFGSCEQLATAFENSRQSQNYMYDGMARTLAVPNAMEAAMAADTGAQKAGGSGTADYSETNVQVEGVDEADIVKTDGEYIYTIKQSRNYYYYDSKSEDTESRLIIMKAYPGEDAEIASETELGDFYPNEIFIHNDRLMIFGLTYEEVEWEEPQVKTATAVAADGAAEEMMIAPYPYTRTMSFTTVQLWDISDRESPELIRSADFEGDYLTSRKIGGDVYFVVNSYPQYRILESAAVDGSSGEGILPVVRDTADSGELKPACGCDDVGYFNEVEVERFVMLISMSMDNDDAEITKEVLVGSGQNVYASQDNLYIAETSWPGWGWIMPMARTASGSGTQEATENTVIHKFGLDDGEISYKSDGKVSGHILNQFSMDEHKGYFRIATTISRASMGGTPASSNNIYILDEGMETVGEIEDIAPGESIYSARFMGDRGYLVTFKQVDPLFVIDLSVPQSPKILGKLKIPGYSDYLHPYDETHLIGIGKEVDESIDADKIHSDNAVYYTAIQGVKLAIFDVSDVENPVEMYKEVIGDRGTQSEAATDHKAFLFDREKELLVVPILLAELKDGQPSSMDGEYTFQGAYVYSINLEDGFELKGKITHVEDEDTFLKSGYYYAGGDYSVKRSLYIGDVLYTLSGAKLKLNSLSDLSDIKELTFGS